MNELQKNKNLLILAANSVLKASLGKSMNDKTWTKIKIRWKCLCFA
jgi:hypothetical protein